MTNSDPVATIHELIDRCLHRVVLSLEEGTDEIEIEDLRRELIAAIAAGVRQDQEQP